MSKIIAIHQPNFFPWLGYFHKIMHSDCFVYLDHVRMNPDQSWVKRVRILNQLQSSWLTIPIASSSQQGVFPNVNELRINNQLDFGSKHLRTIEHNYGKKPYFREIFPFIEEYYLSSEPLLEARNRIFVERVCNGLDINTPRILSSSLNCSESSTSLLIEITQKLKGTIYLCGGGASGYQEDHLFTEAGLTVAYQHFSHPIYEQNCSNDFVSGLSILDALMNIGLAGVKKIIC